LWCIAPTVAAQWEDDYVEVEDYSNYRIEENEGLNDYSEYSYNPIEINELDEARWKELQDELKYPREVKQEEEKELDKPKKPKPVNRSSDQAWASLFKVMLIIMGILVVAFVLFKFLGGDALLTPRNRKIKSGNFNLGLDEIEANIHDLELQDYIQNALDKKDYRLAIRLYYLDIVKSLSNAKRIKWKRDKTNGEYVSELSGSPLHADFRDVTLYFERVWYGNTEVTRQDYDQLSPFFKRFLNKIPNQ